MANVNERVSEEKMDMKHISFQTDFSFILQSHKKIENAIFFNQSEGKRYDEIDLKKVHHKFS
jgi:hypothetical protein